jgi:hypothetical protein
LKADIEPTQARDWPCHHSGKLPIDRFRQNKVLSVIERRFPALSADGSERICDQQAAGRAAERAVYDAAARAG